jgi:hypothetical protein
MDPRERIENLEEAVLTAIKGNQTELWTALPAYVVSYDPVKRTISAQPTISLQASDQFNNTYTLNFPVIPDIPVCFPNGGGFTLTFPIRASSDPAQADECLLIFASRCIDGWFAYGGVQTQVEPRMHDLSDGFAIIGPKSAPAAQAVPGVSTSAVQLRTDDGQSFVQIDNTGKVLVETDAASTTITVKSTGNSSNVVIEALGTGSRIILHSKAELSIVSDTGISLSAPPNTINANGNVLG